MTTRTRTQITIQTRQTITVRPLRDSFRAWCEHCLEVVIALTPESVISLLQIPTSTLYQFLACGKMHAVESGKGSDLICGNSLAGDSTQNEILIEGERK
jgi:hypothetical protein